MATVIRKRALVNGRRRTNAKRKLSLRQILAGFGGKRRQSSAKTRRRTNTPKRRANASRPKVNRAKSFKRTHRKRTRKNISGIAVAGLPAVMNPARKRRKSTKRKNTKMAKRNAHRPRSNKARTNRGHSHHRKTRRSRRAHRNPTVIYRYKTRRNSRRMTGRRRNPGGESTSSLIQQSIFGAAGAVGSRMLPQIVLGSNNTGIMGYGANIVSGLILAWGGRKFFGRSAGFSQ